MKELILLSILLIVGCEKTLEPEDCTEGSVNDSVGNGCISCDEKLSCIFGDWAISDSSAYYTINEEIFKLTSGFTCSAISGSYNIIEFSDSCLNTNLAIQNGFYSYSFKFSDNDPNLLYTNIVQFNIESLQSAFDLGSCQLVDSLTRVNELVNFFDGTPFSP